MELGLSSYLSTLHFVYLHAFVVMMYMIMHSVINNNNGSIGTIVELCHDQDSSIKKH